MSSSDAGQTPGTTLKGQTKEPEKGTEKDSLKEAEPQENTVKDLREQLQKG